MRQTIIEIATAFCLTIMVLFAGFGFYTFLQSIVN